MDKQISIRNYEEKDIEDVLNIFNIFAATSQAVYSEHEINIERLKTMLSDVRVMLILQDKNKIIGFGYLSSYKPYPNFNSTGVLTYFIIEEYTSKGLGSNLLEKLMIEGKSKGITNYLASISSRNLQSLNFHKKHGFEEVGRFKQVATKFGELIDVVWVQKIIK